MNRIALILLLLTFSSLSAGQSDERALKPEVRVGDSWTYRSTNVLGPGIHDHEIRVSFSGDKVILSVSTRKSDGKEFDSAYTSEWNAVTSYNGNMFRPHTGVFQFPLRIGDRHSINFDTLRPRETAVETRGTGTVAVVNWENVEVPAGKFRAIKVVADTLWQPTNGSPAFLRKSTYWYSPEVRRWVKVQITWPGGSGGEELLSYKLNEE